MAKLVRLQDAGGLKGQSILHIGEEEKWSKRQHHRSLTAAKQMQVDCWKETWWICRPSERQPRQRKVCDSWRWKSRRASGKVILLIHFPSLNSNKIKKMRGRL